MGLKIKLGGSSSTVDSDKTSIGEDDAMALSYTDLAEERAKTSEPLNGRRILMDDGGVPIRVIISAKLDELAQLKKISPPNVVRIKALERNIEALQSMLTNLDEGKKSIPNAAIPASEEVEEVFELGQEIYTKQQIIDLKIAEVDRLKKLSTDNKTEIRALESEISELKILLEDENLNIPVEADLDAFIDETPTKPNQINPLATRPKSNRVRNVAGISALIAASALSVIAIKNCTDNLNQSSSEPIEDASTSYDTRNVQDDTSAQSNNDESINPQELSSQLPQTDNTLWSKVVTSVDSKAGASTLDDKAKIRLMASSTNDLVAGLHSDAHTWSDSPEALKDLKLKVETWGGYDFLLASGEACNATSITEWLSCIDADENVPNRHLVVENFEGQIQTIQDVTINPDQKTVKTKLESITTEQVNKVVDEKIANPPKVPKIVSYPAGTSASFETTPTNGLASSVNNIYDAPDAVTLNSVQKTQDVTKVTAVLEDEDLVDLNAPTFEDRFEAIEPLHVLSVQQENVIPSIGDPFEAIEPANIIKSTPIIKVEEPVMAEVKQKGFVENTMSKVSNWIGSAKKWFT